jgi:hypothetical protein
MRINLKTSLFVTIAIASGIVVLLGYFVRLPIFTNLRDVFLQWAVILSAVLLFVGVVNLSRVHWHKVKSKQPGSWYSILLLVSLVLTLIVALAGYWSSNTSILTWLFNYVQVPIEASLMAILSVVLALSVLRMMNRRISIFSLIFIGTLLIVLIGTISLPGFEIELLRDLRSWIVQVVATAGARGILLGVALGAILTGLRVILGADRPYGG